jgi:hypothetical protein
MNNNNVDGNHSYTLSTLDPGETLLVSGLKGLSGEVGVGSLTA